MIKKLNLICMALLMSFFLVGCGGGPEKKSSKPGIDDEYRTSRASDSVSGYNGKPIVKRVGDNGPRQSQITFNENPRYIVYVGEGTVRKRSKSSRPGASRMVDGKAPKTFIITDGTAKSFKAFFKQSDYRKLKGTVKLVGVARFEEILSELNGMGFKRLEGPTVKTGAEAIGTLRSIHLQIDGQRKSIYKARQETLGSAVSPRAIFLHCEVFLINIFNPPGLGAGR
ncbi:MAG: hypothetical protein P1V97_21305 [Planctomycetota bacterium]|nr:hypothetical protein [Planctomycetota bacterium]